MRDDEEIVVVLLNLRPLCGVEDVFERERMQIETRTERAQDFDVPQPIDVDPGHALIIEMRNQFFPVLGDLFLEMGPVVLDEPDDRLAPDRFVARSQRPRRFAWNRVTQFEHESGERLRRERGHRQIFPAPQFHHPETDDREDVADQMRGLGGADRGRIEGWFEKIAHRFDLGRGRTGIGLFNGSDGRVSLRGGGLDRIQVFVGEQAKQDRDDEGGERGRLFAQGREREDTADDDDVERPVVLQRGRALEVELDQIVVFHKQDSLLKERMAGREEKSFAANSYKAASTSGRTTTAERALRTKSSASETDAAKRLRNR